MLNSKKIVALLVVILLVVGIFTIQVQASGVIDLDNLMNTTNDLGGTTGNEITNDLDTDLDGNETTGSVIQPETNKIDTSSGNNLPQTGVTEDITVMFFIIVCVILAIYAYKKIRDYK